MPPLPASFLLAWRPFLDPLDLQAHWFWLLPPTAFFLAVAYRAVRMPSLKGYWRAVISMTAQIIVAIVALGAAFFVLIEWLLPIITPMRPL
ncbi:MAG: hypothetical protein AAF138_04050 [Planctomycetota bacterium]